MKARSHSMPEACPETRLSVQIVQVEVSLSHPLLLLKQALPWEAITEAMTRHGRQHGKNVDGGPGLPWDVSLYVPLVVLMLIKTFDSRQMEAYVAENVVARVFSGRHGDAQGQIRDHSKIARAYAALGKAGIDELNHLVIKEAHRCGFVDERVLSADPTAQELPMGYPHEPGILRGRAQRCGRALTQMHKRGMPGLESALNQVQTILRSGKEHHLFTSGKAAKREVLTRILKEVGALIVHTRPLVQRLETSAERVIQSARLRLMAMHEVIKPLMGQIVHWISTGKVAANKIVHVGIPQARAIVRNKVGKKTELGLAYRISRLGGGYLFGTLITANVDERQMPLKALSG
jgi:NADH:ubiquinone oxidoreductase subunit K